MEQIPEGGRIEPDAGPPARHSGVVLAQPDLPPRCPSAAKNDLRRIAAKAATPSTAGEHRVISTTAGLAT
jgi:hypothetical protein